MNSNAFELVDVDQYFQQNPDFFHYPLLPIEQRKTVQIHESVKIVLGIVQENECRTVGRWVTVTQCLSSPLRFVGNLGHVPGTNSCHEICFGPENIYRMEPREFTVWGRDGVPVTYWGTKGGHPEDSHGNPIHDLQPLCQVSANGHREFRSIYSEMAVSNQWPTLSDLGL